jgi:hypothetical protein
MDEETETLSFHMDYLNSSFPALEPRLFMRAISLLKIFLLNVYTKIIS